MLKKMNIKKFKFQIKFNPTLHYDEQELSN